jgi:hypothetical protein
MPAVRYMINVTQTTDMPACSNRRMGYQMMPHMVAANNRLRIASFDSIGFTEFIMMLITRQSVEAL